MLQQLIDEYETFGDAIITQFSYHSNFSYSCIIMASRVDEIELYISCFNRKRDDKRDLIRIVCRDIIDFKFKRHGGMIFHALIKNDNGIILLDFYPQLFGDPSGSGMIAVADENSECTVTCRQVTYEVVEEQECK